MLIRLTVLYMYRCMISRIALFERRISPTYFLPVHKKKSFEVGAVCHLCSMAITVQCLCVLDLSIIALRVSGFLL